MITILELAKKQLQRFSSTEQRAFHKTLDRFVAASPQTRRSMLKHIGNSPFDRINVKWSLRASRKHRVLLDWDTDHYVVRAFVSRGDHKYYANE